MVGGGGLEDHGLDYVIGAHPVASLARVGLIAARPGVITIEVTSYSVAIAGNGGAGAMSTSDGNVVLAVGI